MKEPVAATSSHLDDTSSLHENLGANYGGGLADASSANVGKPKPYAPGKPIGPAVQKNGKTTQKWNNGITTVSSNEYVTPSAPADRKMPMPRLQASSIVQGVQDSGWTPNIQHQLVQANTAGLDSTVTHYDSEGNFDVNNGEYTPNPAYRGRSGGSDNITGVGAGTR